MKKDKLLYALIIILVLINIGILVFLISPRHPHPNAEFDSVVINELNLNDNQIKQFDLLKRQHHDQVMALDRDMGEKFEEYFSLLTAPENSAKKDSLEKVLASKYEEKVKITYQHFDELKAICTPEQQKKMNKIIPLLMHVISPQKNIGPPRRN